MQVFLHYTRLRIMIHNARNNPNDIKYYRILEDRTSTYLSDIDVKALS